MGEGKPRGRGCSWSSSRRRNSQSPSERAGVESGREGAAIARKALGGGAYDSANTEGVRAGKREKHVADCGEDCMLGRS